MINVSRSSQQFKDDAQEKIIQVLHVDDDFDILKISKKYLEEISNNSLQITSLQVPQNVFSILQSNQFDVIVSDYQMPNYTGLQLLKDLKKQQVDIPFIIFTGRGREEIVIQALNLGANYYINKGGDPISQYRELLHTIETAVKHQRVEQALKKSQTRNQAILNAIPDLVFQFDLEGKFLAYAGQISKLYVSPDQFLGQNLVDVIPVEIAHRFLESIKMTLTSGEMQILTYELPFRDGNRIHEARMVQNGQDQVLTIVRDVSDLHAAQQQTKFQAQLLESVGESIIASDLNGNIIYWGKGATKLFGYAETEIIGKSITILLDTNNPQHELDQFKKIKQKGYWSGVHKLKKKDQSTFWADTTISVVKNENNLPSGFIGIDRVVRYQKPIKESLSHPETQ